jgi:hypothetical protein
VREALANMQAPDSAAEAIVMLEGSRDELRAHATAFQRELERAATRPMSVDARSLALEHPVKRWLEAKARGLADDR